MRMIIQMGNNNNEDQDYKFMIRLESEKNCKFVQYKLHYIIYSV